MFIVGLGNPGARYAHTRHNIGFWVVDLIAERWGRPVFREKFHGQIAQTEMTGTSGSSKLVLLKPQTFMNLSGQSVQPAMSFFKESPETTLVIHDELDLPLGRLMLKKGGGSGGHNGLKSITERLGTADYCRLRVGIGRPDADFRGDIADFVLQGFPPHETDAVQKLLDRSGDAVEAFVLRGLSDAMNHINRRP